MPLLAIILLITFDSYSEVPGDLHLFYDHAYTALFHYHDSFKDSFTRERRSGLSIDRFKRVFSIFCLFSYYKQQYEFSESDIRELLKSSIDSSSETVDPEKILYDITQSVCLMQKDGLSYVFCHRSFQEYFAAYCVCFVFQEKTKDILSDIFLRHDDSSLSMAYRMNSDLVQRNFIIPKFNKIPIDNSYLSFSSHEILEKLGIGAEVFFTREIIRK